MDIFDLKNKISVVTGGYGHIGSGICLALLNRGSVVIVAGRSENKFNQKFQGLENDRLFFKEIDISNSKSIDIFFAQIQKEYGRIDILFNNAHYVRGFEQVGISDEDWAYTMEGVLGSVHKCIRAVVPIMKENGSGKIINISSMYGVVSPNFELYQGEDCEKYTNPPHYGAAKAGIVQLTKYFASYLGKHNINVNSITPGPFPKEQIQIDNPEFIERLKNRNPLNKIGRPEDIQGVSLLLASSASDFITGQNFIIDGGWTIW